MNELEGSYFEEWIDVDAIDPWPAAAVRAAVDDDVIAEYGAAFDELPPPEVVRDEQGRPWLADGSYRLAAARRLGKARVLCRVRTGSRLDAFRRASRANDAHGVRATSADKRARIRAALRDPEMAGWSTRRIAEACGTSHSNVARIRAETGVSLSQCDGGSPPGRPGDLADRLEALEGSLRADPARSDAALAREHGVSRATVARRRKRLASATPADQFGTAEAEAAANMQGPSSPGIGRGPRETDQDDGILGESAPPPGSTSPNPPRVGHDRGRIGAEGLDLQADPPRGDDDPAGRSAAPRIAGDEERAGLDEAPAVPSGGSSEGDEPGALAPREFGGSPAGGMGTFGRSSRPGEKAPDLDDHARRREEIREALLANASESNRELGRRFGICRKRIPKLRRELGLAPSAWRNDHDPATTAPRDATAGRTPGPDLGADTLGRLSAERKALIRRIWRCPEGLRSSYPGLLRGLASEMESGRLGPGGPSPGSS